MKAQSSDTKVDVPVEQKPKEIPEILKGWNNKTEESYRKNKLTHMIPYNLDFQNKYFLQRIDAEKYPVEKEVTKIVRLKTTDYNSKDREQKEFVYWFENWYGKDWLGQTVPPVTDHIEGSYMEQDIEPKYERQVLKGYNKVGQHEVHYIQFSKKAVDEIIAKSTYKNMHKIKFLVKFPDGLRNAGFTYEQFVNYPFEECYQAMRTNGGPAMYLYEQQQQAKKDSELLKQQKQYS
jgi:hypothetical protein